jgi:hypothetical protein
LENAALLLDLLGDKLRAMSVLPEAGERHLVFELLQFSLKGC